ncbi:endonuclease III, partial [Tremellales sp. Uapishka_1]
MAPSSAKSTRSAQQSRVVEVEEDCTVKAEPVSPSTTHSLRRKTRSSDGAAKLDLSAYTYNPTTPSPRKKPKLEPSTPVASASDLDTKPKPKSASKKPVIQLALEKPHPAPPKWEAQYNLIKRMREGLIAPVDDMSTNSKYLLTDKTLRFHMLISLMLSSQTKDPVTSQAVTNLHHTLPGGLTAESLAAATPEMVQDCINKVGFWRRKTEYIQEAAKKLLEVEGDMRGDVPNTLDSLCELKGVGPKMAFLALQCAWNINAGIGVDVHVHRITNRLRWHKPQTTTPEQTRLNLQSWLPPHLHKPINPMMMICQPVGPRCDICLLGPRGLCPSYVRNVKSEGRKEVLYTFTPDEPGAKLEIGYEEGLVKMDPEEDVKLEEASVSVKIEEPGMQTVDEVLEVLNVVDGVDDIGLKKET